MKKVFIFILIAISTIISIIYKDAVLNNHLFNKKNYIKIKIKNDYRQYFFYKEKNPIYVFKNKILDKYIENKFENKKNSLIYPHQQTIAIIDYIKDIQYISSVWKTYKAKFLHNKLNQLTNLSPHRTHIYDLWSLLLPTSKSSDISKKRKYKTWEDAIKLWEKWVYFNCDPKKIKNIKQIKEENFFDYAYSKTWWFYQENKNPCISKSIASNLWFNYFHYLKDLSNTIKYYKIAWFHEDALAWTIWMVSIANWMLWEHEKSMYLMVQKIISLQQNTKDNDMNQKKIEYTKKQIKKNWQRAQEELNFYIISQAEKNSTNCKKNYECLKKNNLIEKEINKLKKKCWKNKKIESLDKIINKNIKTSIQNSKCLLFWLSINNQYIIWWKLKSALIEDWKYFYDKDKKTRWVWKFNSN